MPFNLKIASYPDGSRRLTICDHHIFADIDHICGSGFFASKTPEQIAEMTIGQLAELDRLDREREEADRLREERNDNARRARQRVFDIAAMNPFTHFVTCTLDKAHIDRFDEKLIGDKTQNFLANAAQRHGLIYLFLPERHKNGALHLHGLIAGDLTYIRAKSAKTGRPLSTMSGQPIYNMPQWGWGHSTAIPIYGDGVTKYITKYVTKNHECLFGNYYYAGGKGLIREPEISYDKVEFEGLEFKEYAVPGVNRRFKYATIGSGGEVK